MWVSVLYCPVGWIRVPVFHLPPGPTQHDRGMGDLPRHRLGQSGDDVHVSIAFQAKELRDVKSVLGHGLQTPVPRAVAPRFHLGLELCINPPETFVEILSRPAHRWPPILRAFQQRWEVPIEVLRPEVPRVRIGLVIHQTIRRQWVFPCTEPLQVAPRWVVDLGEVHRPRRLPLLKPGLRLVDVELFVAVLVKVLEVRFRKASGKPIAHCHSAVNLPHHVQHFVRPSIRNVPSAIPDINGINQIITSQSPASGTF
mmetsp:Transcript_37919/g.101013  ORF Transcript_37919/g.101013 Transcript_37919/m.101013 type:complete len:255 (+) Transcript_37919:150-914(+)